jgi:hypothetical protein
MKQEDYVKIFEDAACKQTYKMAEGVEAVVAQVKKDIADHLYASQGTVSQFATTRECIANNEALRNAADKLYSGVTEEPDLSNLLCVLVELKLKPFRSGGFINKDYDMARLSVDLPIIEAKSFIKKLNEYLGT